VAVSTTRETDPVLRRFLNRSYSGYLVPTNADIPNPDVLSIGGFDEEASRSAPRAWES
jgi:xanthine dehydrogenase YagR molybdenum-binding subunit